MPWLTRVVGLFPKGTVVIVLVVGWILWTLIQSGATEEKMKTVIETQKEYIETRKKVENATKSIDSSDARKWLYERQSNK